MGGILHVVKGSASLGMIFEWNLEEHEDSDLEGGFHCEHGCSASGKGALTWQPM